MMTQNLTESNIEKIASLFPHVITETIDENGAVKKAINTEMLLQELSDDIVDGNSERYQLTWVGKKEAILLANQPVNKTLRPVKEDSVNWDTTENLYIKGDNLDALKLLQESYLNKIKCIYIDPPYNTGKDFIYKDIFKQDADTYLEASGQKDESGNRLFQNTDNNGRFHSHWLSMMYPRLKLARNLLCEDGVIFISIDDNELANLKKLCDEVFGENSFIDIFSWVKTETPANLSKKTKKAVEYILCYEKNRNNNKFRGLIKESKSSNGLMNQSNSYKRLIFPKNIVDTALTDGVYKAGKYGTQSYKIVLTEDTEVKNGYFIKDVVLEGNFKWTQEKLNNELISGTKVSIRTIAFSPSYEREEYQPEVPWNLINRSFNVKTNEESSKELEKLFGTKIFDYPKPTSLIKYLLNFIVEKQDIVLDFFSGSATTAHAVMHLNAEDGGNRKYIMVQLPENCNETSQAYKEGYKNISEIGIERIKRAAKKIQEETGANIDYGLRIFRVDTSNMKDVYYNPSQLKHENLTILESNIKDGRTSEDLLIQVLLELGLQLSLPMETKTIKGKKVHFVGGDSLVCCCDDNISETLVRELAKTKPFKIVFKDNSFKDDATRINMEEIFKMISPSTSVKVI